MCSSPKGGSSKPRLSSRVESSFSDMSSAEYSDMVHRANESYERRQQELIEYRKTHKKRIVHNQKKTPELSFFAKLKLLFTQSRPAGQIE